MRSTGSTGRERTRKPADERRRELAEAAAAHFHRLGFHGVSLADVAAGVGVTAPAVYRHYRNKNALLDGAITTGLDHVDAALDGARSLSEALERLAEAALRRRDVWVLLQREMRHLDDDERTPALARFRALAATFAGHVAAARPDLDDGRVQVLATAAFAVLASPSTHPVPLAHEHYRDALVRASAAVCAADLQVPTSPDPGPRPGPAAEPGRGDQILDTAIGLFHRHGYAAVSVDDIGAAAGMAGPSIYHHFPTKS
ncbi:MAG: helix-turn-helix domain-containing protein, partial [Pseudonocardia sediminis]